MKRINRFLLCIMIVLPLLSAGNVFAGTELSRLPDGENLNANGSVYNDRTETAEAPDFNTCDIKSAFIYAGSAEGVDFYIRCKDYRERIIRDHGLAPDMSEELTTAVEEELRTAEKIGDAAAVYTESGRPAAKFSRLTEFAGITRYISEKGRYIADIDENLEKLVCFRSLISSLDSSSAYLTDNGKRLDLLYDKKAKSGASLAYVGDENGKRIYKNAETGEFAWLSEDMKRYYGTFVYCAENDKLKLLADLHTSLIGIENRDNGYIWWSSPLEANHDPKANEIFSGELRSSSVLNYGIPEKRNDSMILRSGNSDDCTVSVSLIENGIRVEYDYKKDGFKYPVEYTLGEDHLRAELKVSEIEETGRGKIATRVSLLGSLGAAADDENGYFVIPDGSGALVRFGSKKAENAGAYLQRVYGNDVTAVPTSRGASAEQLYLPVYGIVKEDNAMLAVAEKGDSNALLSVKTSACSNTSYNLCSFVFILRSTDTYYMTGSSNTSFTVFESGSINSDDVAIRYYPIAKKNADYNDIAERYREYLIKECDVTKKADDGSSPLYIGLYGGVQKKSSVFGIPVNAKASVTDYGQARDILEKLRSNGVDDMTVTYKNWTDNGIRNRVDIKAKPSRTLGGKKAFSDLMGYMKDNSFKLYPVSDNRDFYSGSGYYSFSDTAVRVSGAYSRIVSYDLAYGVPDGFVKNKSLLSPSCFADVLGSGTAHKFLKRGFEGISVGELTTSLYGDYGKKNISRYEAMNRLTDCYSIFAGEFGNGILADNANAYALPYVSCIMNVPLTSSRYDMFDEDIPFYQIVLHGIIPYSTPPVNASPDPGEIILMAAATGSSLNYDMIWEKASFLNDTEFNIYYYANYMGWTERAASAYKLIKPILSRVSGSTISDHNNEDDGKRVTTVYSDGTEITVDFEMKIIVCDGIVYELGDI